jgi:hypothetical protein
MGIAESCSLNGPAGCAEATPSLAGGKVPFVPFSRLPGSAPGVAGAVGTPARRRNVWIGALGPDMRQRDRDPSVGCFDSRLERREAVTARSADRQMLPAGHRGELARRGLLDVER